MLLMTADFLRPDKLATSGNLMAHGTHGKNGDYLVEIGDFVSKLKDRIGRSLHRCSDSQARIG